MTVKHAKFNILYIILLLVYLEFTLDFVTYFCMLVSFEGIHLVSC